MISLSNPGHRRGSGLLRRVRSWPPVIGFLAVITSPMVLARPAGTGEQLIKEAGKSCRIRAISLAGTGGEECWSSLAVMQDGQTLVGLSSRSGSAVLLLVDPSTDKSTRVVDLAKVGHLIPSQRQPKIHVTPVVDTEGSYQFLSHFGLDTHLPLHGSRIGYEGMHRWRWNPKTGKAEHLGLLLRGEGAVALSASADGRRLFVVSFPQALLLEIDTRTDRVRNLGRTNACYAPRHILVDPWDNPYVLDHKGRFWTVAQPSGLFHPLDAVLPARNDVSGNLLSQGLVSSVAWQGRAKHLVMSAWGQLFEVRFTAPGKLKVIDRGRPASLLARADWKAPKKRLVTAAGLAVGRDGWLYVAISGYNKAVDKSGDSYIIRCRPDGTKVEMVARLSGRLISYICGSNAVDPVAGRVFFVGSHLTHDSPYLVVLEDMKG